MNDNQSKNAVINSNKKEYQSPTITDYGKMSELTQTIIGSTGDDGGMTPSSYTAS